MKVSGLTSSVSDARHRATIASAGADSNASAARRASSSITSNPTLCRVPLYLDPGFPSPAISFTAPANRRCGCRLPATALLLLLVLLGRGGGRLGAFFFLLALLDHLGLGRRRRRGGRRGLRRRRRLL